MRSWSSERPEPQAWDVSLPQQRNNRTEQEQTSTACLFWLLLPLQAHTQPQVYTNLPHHYRRYTQAENSNYLADAAASLCFQKTLTLNHKEPVHTASCCVLFTGENHMDATTSKLQRNLSRVDVIWSWNMTKVNIGMAGLHHVLYCIVILLFPFALPGHSITGSCKTTYIWRPCCSHILT